MSESHAKRISDFLIEATMAACAAADAFKAQPLTERVEADIYRLNQVRTELATVLKHQLNFENSGRPL
ncbi:hypothetical protein [Caballeronia grimmiae]|uniref:hypothetical protein n=1 Tax=Caballeronia grimmiae TaxID=1071679 RepID=UPI0038B782E5